LFLFTLIKVFVSAFSYDEFVASMAYIATVFSHLLFGVCILLNVNKCDILCFCYLHICYCL